MLDLKKLAENLRVALAKETTESIDKWFQEYENESVQSYLGQGEYCTEPVKKDCYSLSLESITKENKSIESENDYTEYLQAA